MRRRFASAALIAGMLLLAACEAEPTPLPVILAPTVTITAPPADALRYAVAPNAAGLIPELNQIATTAQIVTLDALPPDLDPALDLVVALGDLSGWQRAPSAYTVALIIDTTQPPLDDPAVQALIQRAAVPQDLLTGLEIPGATLLKDEPVGDLRADLANAGYPDGFDLTLTAIYAPGMEPFAARLRQAGINAQIVTSAPADLMLVSGSTDPTRIDLFSASISYLANPALNIDFAPSGFPLANPP